MVGLDGGLPRIRHGSKRNRNMWQPLSMAFFVACVAWFISIFASTDPQVRMERTCLPLEYGGRIGTSSMMLIKADWAGPTNEFFEGVNYGCKFVIWRMFYEDSWNSAKPADNAPGVVSNSASDPNKAANQADNPQANQKIQTSQASPGSSKQHQK
jgi:hypothetical protein